MPSSASRQVDCASTVVLNKGTDDEISCHGYRSNICKKILFYMVCILTLGVPFLLLYWYPHWKVLFLKSSCPLNKADTVLLKDLYEHKSVEQVVVEQYTDGPGYESTFRLHTPRNYTMDLERERRKAPSEFTYIDSEEDDALSANDTTRLTSSPAGAHGNKLRLKYFMSNHVRYIWHQDSRSFQRLRGLDGNITCQMIPEKFQNGLFPEEQIQKLNVYGENNINVPVKSFWLLMFEEGLNPFYFFQIFSVLLWNLDQYYYYAQTIFGISGFSLFQATWETRKQSIALRDMVGTTETTVTVLRGSGDEEEIATRNLVPGDVILIPPQGCTMMCDAVLLSGNAIVNESMLTGESVPVTKTPLAVSDVDEIYEPEDQKRHTLFCGTQVIQTRNYSSKNTKAVVVRTGFSTAKGELVRSILFPKPVDFRFYNDAMKFVMVMGIIASVGMGYSIYILISIGVSAGKVILRALDIVTIVVPPALPAAMTVGQVYAQGRLKKQDIYCISPNRINMSGKLKLVCFDKTGTLTMDGLDMWGVVPTDTQTNQFQEPLRNPAELGDESRLTRAMATCHSLTTIDNEIRGDPLDEKMFNSVNWRLTEHSEHGDPSKFNEMQTTYVKPLRQEAYYVQDEEEPLEVGIIHQFPFSSGLQRMSVATLRRGDDHMELYSKGSPEKIASLCRPETLPHDFNEKLHEYTMKGYRVIALAWKPLNKKLNVVKVAKIARDQVENELEFLGLLIMENQLKEETTPVIHELKNADIRTVMVTGDNMLTAVSVARNCGIVGKTEKVILVHIHAPEGTKAAYITWEVANNSCNLEESNEQDTPSGPAVQHTDIEVDIDGKFHFAITGHSFGLLRMHFPNLVDKINLRGSIYARMSPDQKAQLVEQFMALGYTTAMCGDGANDCGALKAAHVGISLSDSEASVAAPFTSKKPNIECVPKLIKEGRCSLVTTFGVFKFMALYSIIQFVAVLILYNVGANLGDGMFLYSDLAVITVLVILMGRTWPSDVMTKKRPPGSLMSPQNIFSIIAQIMLVILFQVVTNLYLLTQPWFEPAIPNLEADNTTSMEGAVIFYVSCFQYLSMAFIQSKGAPFRKSIASNRLFLAGFIILTLFTILLTLYPVGLLGIIFSLKEIPLHLWKFRLTLLGICGINFLCSWLLEMFADSDKCKRLVNVVRRKKEPRNKYKKIEAELQRNPDWPQIDQIVMATQHGGPLVEQ